MAQPESGDPDQEGHEIGHRVSFRRGRQQRVGDSYDQERKQAEALHGAERGAETGSPTEPIAAAMAMVGNLTPKSASGVGGKWS
jgi:hypothetical protein